MSFCRITGRSRGLPKPNYFPLLAPISPADAKRCCRITGKSYGLPSHHYIPVLLTTKSGKSKCRITNVAGELGPHHYGPEINYGNRKHQMLADYRYIFPILDGSTEAQKMFMDMLLTKQVTEQKRYVYTVQERRCSLVFSAQMEAAVRDGDVKDVMLAKDSDTVLIKTKHGRNVSMDFKDFTEDIEMYEGEGPNAEVLRQRERQELEEKKKKRKRAAGLSSMKKIFENKEKLAEVEEIEEEKQRQERLAKKAKVEEIKHEKCDVKSYNCNNFDVNHMRSKSSIVMCSGEWKDQMHPLIESWDWDDFEKEVPQEQILPKATKLPPPVKLTPYHCDTEIYEVDRKISEVAVSLENVPCVNPLKPIKTRPSETILNAVKEMQQERVVETLNIVEKLSAENKMDMLPSIENLPKVIKNIKKGKREKVAKIPGLTLDINKAKTFIPGQHINTPQGPVFIPGQSVQTPSGPVFVPGLSVNTPGGPALIPGHVVMNENTEEPFFLAGQVLQTSNGEEFVCGQTIKNKDDTYRFIEGQTVLSEEGLKFIPGKIVNNESEEIFVPGQTIMTPEGVQFVPGQTMTESSGLIFTPGQNAKINNEWQFVPGQVVTQDDELHFVPGATLATPNGLKFVPGQTVAINGETCFIPGITKTTSSDTLEFVPGTTVETIDGPKFIEGQIVHTDSGEKFMPGKTIVQANGHVEFQVAKSAEDIIFSESAPVGLPIDIKTSSLSEESLYVFGHMIQTAKGIEFYPGSRIPKIEGKVVPGRLVKNEANESRFVPGTMVEGIFVPGQIVFTENGEQFVPGQVVDTADGPKFVPGQVVNTKSGPKFVPGQTIHTIDGPRFVPGQIIETKAGPTFIPGQVISTEDEGSRFVPGQVVDTEEGPRFVPGRVIETDDNGVTFVPGQIVQTPEGLKFVAPDLTEGEEGLEFSVQSFVVTPEELKLLKVKTNPNDTTSTRGELSIDTNMLRQLSEAGMGIGRQVPAELPKINVILNETRNAEALKAFVTDYGLKDDVANQLMDVIKSIIEMSTHLKTEIHDNKSSDRGSSEGKISRTSKRRMEIQEHIGSADSNGESPHQENVKNSIAAAVLAALVTAEQFEEVNNNNSKEKYNMILKSIDTILGKAIDEDFVTAMYRILQTEEEKDILCDEILDNTSEPKVELIKIAINSSLHKYSFTEEDIIEKFGDFLSSENEVLGPAFKNITKNDTSLLHHVLSHISESISFIKTDNEATETLQKAIVSAVQDASSKELESILQDADNKNLKELIVQSVGLAKLLGMTDVARSLLAVFNDEDSLSKIAEDATSLSILRRLTVMRKLADKTPSLHSALNKLKTDVELARTDPKLRDLVRESAALMIVPEEPPLQSSADIPLSLLQPENSLAMEDFLLQRKKGAYRPSGALLIMKRGLQAVIPREASRAVLTGQVAYTVLDENGLRHFEPLHVFSALNLSQPTAHRFSMYSCPIVDEKDDEIQTFTGYCNISNHQRITRLGGWNRKPSGALLDREIPRSRISSLDHTPSYRAYSSRSTSMSRSRSSCSRSPPKVEDVVVATSDYTASGDDEVSLKAGDIVEVLDTKSTIGSKKPRLDPSLDVGNSELLDSSAAKHKLTVRPKKNHPRGKSPGKNGTKAEARWLVRVLEDVAGGEVLTRQGYVPSHVLIDKDSNPEKDKTALAARRQAVVRELIETEEEFGRDMQQVVNRYMRPMDKATTPKSVFDNRELLFSNFKQIAEFHSTVLLEGIKYYAGEPRMLGRALLRMEREFDKHVAYCRDEPRAMHLLTTDPHVGKYFQDLADDLGDDKGIIEHLKLPIQRINDYQLLLKELVKYSNRIGEDCTDLQKALELFLGVPNRATDNKFIASIEGYRGNIYKLGRLLTHDWFTVRDSEKSKERYLFLFKARILVCKVKRVSDNCSVFVLKDIIKLPEVEVNDLPEDKFKFELHVPGASSPLTLTAHKEPVKTTWLSEIRQHASDVVALAEHKADDLEVLVDQPLEPPQIVSPEPEEKRKKRERTEETTEAEQKKRTKVEEVELAEVLTREESLQQLKAKRKASLEKAEIARKISKTEVTESSISEVQSSEVKSAVKTDLEIKSSVTEVQSSEKSSVKDQSATKSVKTASKVESTETVAKSKESKSSVQEKSKESARQATFISEQSSITASSVDQKSTSKQKSESSSVQSSSVTVQQTSSIQQQSATVESVSSSATKVEGSSVSTSSAAKVSKVEAVTEKAQEKSAVVEVLTEKAQEDNSKVETLKKQALAESLKAESVKKQAEVTSSKAESVIEQAKLDTTKASIIEKTQVTSSDVEFATQQAQAETSKVETLREQAKVETSKAELISNKTDGENLQVKSSTQKTQVESPKVESVTEQAKVETSKAKSLTKQATKLETVTQQVQVVSSNVESVKEQAKVEISKAESVTEKAKAESKIESVTEQAEVESLNVKSVKEQAKLETLKAESITEKAKKVAESLKVESTTKQAQVKSLKVESGKEEAKFKTSKAESVIEQVKAENKVESVTQQARIESSKVEPVKEQAKAEIKVESVAQEAQIKSLTVESVKEQAKQETLKAESIKEKAKIVTESSKLESTTKQAQVESSKDESVKEQAKSETTKVGSVTEEAKVKSSKVKSVAAETKSETQVSQTVTEADNGGDEMSRYSRSSRLSGEYESSSTQKLSSSGRYESSSSAYESTGLSSSYSRRESGSRIESGRYEGSSIEGGATTRYESSSKYESSNLENGTSTRAIESSNTSAYAQIDGDSSKYESYTSSKAIANGAGSVSKSESSDGKPTFSKTLEGINIEPGENAAFECSVRESSETVKVTWLRDNKPFPDRLMDRCTISSVAGQHKLELMHCREDDSGIYTAMAENVKGNTHCTAQLVVHQLTADERKERNAAKAPYFVVALNDTEILENTFLRFMVKVKGDPNPEVNFYREGKEIKTSSESDRVKIVRTLADRGCYELVIADVTPADKGTYSCRAMNEYGEVTSEAIVTVVDDKNIFGELLPGGEGLLAKGEKPTFAWKRDGEAFDPEERFKVLLGDDEDSLALVFQHVRPEDAGMYTCVAKTSTGNISCSAELTVQGAVNQLHREPEKPTLVIEHREAVVSAGGSAMLELQCKGYPKPEVVFKHDGKVIEADARHKFLYEDEESMSLVIKNATSADSGVYEVTASNELGQDSTEIKLIVKNAPKIKKKVLDQTCTVGDNHTVTIEIEGTPTPDVTFFKDGQEIKGSDRISIVKESEEVYKITIKGCKLTDAGSYSVVAKNEVNQCSDFWQWHVVTAPKILQKMGAEKIVGEKESVKFEIKTEAEPAPTVKWFKNKVELVESSTLKISSSGETHSISISSATRADAAEYSCEIRNVHGAATDASQLRVRCGPVFTQKLKDTTAKEGDVNVEFTVSVEAYPEPSIKWYMGDVEITEKKSVFTRVDEGSTHKLILKEVSAEMSGKYSCKVSNELGADACEATFTVNTKPRITKSLVDMTVDAGQTLKLEVEVEGTPDPKVKWFKDGKEVNLDARIKIERDTQRLENYNLTVTLIKEEDGGEYEVRAENEMGSVSSKSTVTVHTKEVHSRFKKEAFVENEVEDENKSKKLIVEEVVDDGNKQTAEKSKSEAETAEEKSFWDDEEDGKAQKANTEDLEKSDAYKAQKSVTEAEVAEEKSIWDENHNEQNKKAEEEDVEIPTKQTGKKNVTEPETAEEVPIEEELSTKRKSIKKEVAEEPLTAESEGRVFQTVTTFKSGDDGSITASKVSSTRSHGAIITAPPTVKDSNMKDGHIYESLPHSYSVTAVGFPKPKVRWLHDGKEVRPSKHVKITNEGDLFKLEIDSVEMEDGGKWQCELTNEVGKKVVTAQLDVTSVNEFRKPIFTSPLEAVHVMQREPATLTAVCTADPLPHVSWLLNGELLMPSAAFKATEESKEIEHGLKECTYTLHIPSGRHTDTGVYTIQAKNQYGVGESSARLDILLRPEIEGFADVSATPYEETTFVAVIHANPIAEVLWSKDGLVIQPSGHYEIVEDRSTETFKLTVKNIEPKDGGAYTLTAKNEIGETAAQATLTVITGEPVFTKPLQKESIKDYSDATLKVRADGTPKPDIKWYKDGTQITNDDRHAIKTEVSGQVESELEIKHFNTGDAGKYVVHAINLAGSTTSEAQISLAQTTPGFTHKLERQKDVDEGEPLELKVKVDGSPMPTATWYKDGMELPKTDARVLQTALPDGTIKLNIEHVTPADCGAYKLVLSNPNGESSALCAVAVNPTPRKPSFSQELSDVKAVVGQPLKLEAVIMAFPAPEVKWFKDGLPIRPSQAVNFINQPGGVIGLSIDSCRPEDAGVYSLTVHNKLGDVASKANVEVVQREKKPAFLAELQPCTVIEGFPAKMEVKVLGHPAPLIKWTHNGKEIVPDGTHVRIVSQPDGSQALLIDKATAQDGGEYAVVAVNEKGEVASKAELSVASRADESSPQERPQLIHGLRDVTAEEGQPFSITCPFVGNPVPDVAWTKDGVPLRPSERVTLTCDGKRVGLEISPVELPDAGVYAVKLVNPLGEDASEGNIIVRKVYQPPVFTQKFSDLQQLPTFDAKFPARVNGVPTPEIEWLKDGKSLRNTDKYHIKRDGDAVCLYVRDVTKDDAGKYTCVAKNREGEAKCEGHLEVVETIQKRQKMEPPAFLKKIGDTEVYRGMSAKFTACATGSPDPDVEWFRNGDRLFPSERIRMDKETTGLLRLTIGQVDPNDVGTYVCRIYNPHGEDKCSAELTYDSLEPRPDRRPISDQYTDFDKMKKTGVPMPLGDRPIISQMTDRHLTLSWKPSIPHGPRFPVTYQVEMCEVPDGDWFTARTGLRSCVCDIRNLEPFRDYKFRIRVENKYGVSDPSPHNVTHRSKLEPDPPKFVPYLEPGIDFRPETSPYFPKDYDIERPLHDGYEQAPRFLRQEYDSQYGVKGHNVNLFWFVYGYPKPKMQYYFNDEPIEIGGRYDWSYTRNGQATLFINKMLERDAGWYEAVATNEHGQARQRVRLEVAEYPTFIKRLEETIALERKTVKIVARVAGVPYPDIKWYKDWQPLTCSSRMKLQHIEPDTQILVIHDVILKDAGLYSISARNVAGAVSCSAMLHVEETEYDYSCRIREHPPRIKPSSKPFGDFYDLGDELGRGVQGVVYHAAERLSGRNYAAKIMHGHSALKPFMKNELDIMNILNHRHLLRLHDAYEHEHTLALVMELAGGGELVRDKLLRSSSITEREIAGYMRQLLRGLKYMHDNDVAHLGLTIGELLISHAGSDELKLCDFGLSRRIQFGKHATLDYGMPEFVAPEVAGGEGVGFHADMWSVGIITYILLGGHSPFRGINDRETLMRVREGRWEWHDEAWWSNFSVEARDFISKLLVYNVHERMNVNDALNHPWLTMADKIYQDEYQFTLDRLRNYYNLYRDWTSNAQCRNWFRRRPLSGAFEHPSKMVYPPGEIYTPEGTPERASHERKPGPWDLKFKQWEHPDWEVSAKSESHYQQGPDTYLLQLRDTDFPVRLREYMKVACNRSHGYSLSVHDTYDPRTPIIRERRRFTDIMDEEIDDERRERINNYGTESYTIRRLRHELGTRLDSYAEAQAFMESKKDGQLPFFREKPQLLPIREGEPAQLSCYAVGDPKPSVQWFKNDMVIAEGQRIKIVEDEEGRSTLKFEPAMHHDIGFYKVVARNKMGQTVARTRIVEATTPDAPDSPTAAEISDTEVLLRWKQPKYDGNSPVVCYSLQYKEGDGLDWKDVAQNIDHEFFVVRELTPETSYQFRLSSRNRIGWSDKGIPTHLVKTKTAGTPKIEVTKAMKHLQQMTESGVDIVLDEERPKLNYATEESPLDWDTSDKFTEKYSFISELWRGKFSIVVKGVDKANDSVVVAKILENRPDTEVQIKREFECLRRLRHERISNLFAAYQAPGSPVAALILEKLQGADVLTYLSSRHDYNEQMVATIVTQILDGLQYLHWRGYCHLDLQPDNVVMASVRSIQVKLIDFGSAHRVTKLGTSVPQVGDLDYKAPEIVSDEPAYPQTDIWSLGVLTYIMLSGVSPFRGADDVETKQNIAFVRYRFEHLYKEITQEATRFLMFLFKKVPLKRPSAEECHEHRWLTQSDFMNKKRERAVFLGNRLKEFSDEYHERKSQEASQADTISSAFGQISPRHLTRSNSIQDELSTTFSSR